MTESGHRIAINGKKVGVLPREKSGVVGGELNHGEGQDWSQNVGHEEISRSRQWALLVTKNGSNGDGSEKL